jgi:hypothetical protein
VSALSISKPLIHIYFYQAPAPQPLISSWHLRFCNYLVTKWSHRLPKAGGFISSGGLMPRKKQTAPMVATSEASTATAVAEPESNAGSPAMKRPDYIDGPPVDERGDAIVGPRNPDAKNWGDPYKVIYSSKQSGFEMGEHRRFKQRVFKFSEKPADDILAALKDAGFSYRANEKAWTIQATPDTRRISEELAHRFAGPSEARGR